MSSKESIAPSVECECLTIKNATSGLKNKAPNSILKVGTVHAFAACGLTVIENTNLKAGSLILTPKASLPEAREKKQTQEKRKITPDLLLSQVQR